MNPAVLHDHEEVLGRVFEQPDVGERLGQRDMLLAGGGLRYWTLVGGRLTDARPWSLEYVSSLWGRRSRSSSGGTACLGLGWLSLHANNHVRECVSPVAGVCRPRWWALPCGTRSTACACSNPAHSGDSKLDHLALVCLER